MRRRSPSFLASDVVEGPNGRSVMFAYHLDLRVLEIIPTNNVLVPCAGDNTQRLPLRR